MTTFVMIPGAGGAGRFYWREVATELERLGHGAVPVEIRGDDPALGLPDYAAITDEAIGEHRDIVLVAQSMGGFTVPMLTKLDRVARIVFVNAMIPLPGETPGQWFGSVGQRAAFEAAAVADGRPTEFDVDTVFLHDIPAEIRATMGEGDRNPAETPFGQPCTFQRWPDVPLHVVVGAGDRLFPPRPPSACRPPAPRDRRRRDPRRSPGRQEPSHRGHRATPHLRRGRSSQVTQAQADT